MRSLPECEDSGFDCLYHCVQDSPDLGPLSGGLWHCSSLPAKMDRPHICRFSSDKVAKLLMNVVCNMYSSNEGEF